MPRMEGECKRDQQQPHDDEVGILQSWMRCIDTTQLADRLRDMAVAFVVETRYHHQRDEHDGSRYSTQGKKGLDSITARFRSYHYETSKFTV